MAYPQNVGIKAMEIYVPAQCLDQELFEKHQEVSAGKYTIGLGLRYMNYCDDREAVSSLLSKYNIDPCSIGRLDVGTESPVDKAKSVKSVLTQLFEPAGNTSLEGVDSINACYGGTASLFNAVNWVESRSWDGRNAIVVASDIALYDQPASRPTGGAGCVAMLIGPDAVLSVIPQLRGTYTTHAYDFYKPDFKVEYPLVNGHESIRCYLKSLDGCYSNLRQRMEASSSQINGCNGHGPADVKNIIDLFDYMAFHTPNCKLVSKSYGRLKYNDCLASTDDASWDDIPGDFRNLDYQSSLTNKDLEKSLVMATKDAFEDKVAPCILAPSRCGNMYTGSLYCSLLSLISNIDIQKASGKVIGMFSYGSGIVSTLFALKVTGDMTEMVQKVDLMKRLEIRHISTPEEYEEAYKLRAAAYGRKGFKPQGSTDSLFSGTYYLSHVDDEFKRHYLVKA